MLQESKQGKSLLMVAPLDLNLAMTSINIQIVTMGSIHFLVRSMSTTTKMF